MTNQAQPLYGPPPIKVADQFAGEGKLRDELQQQLANLSKAPAIQAERRRTQPDLIRAAGQTVTGLGQLISRTTQIPGPLQVPLVGEALQKAGQAIIANSPGMTEAHQQYQAAEQSRMSQLDHIVWRMRALDLIGDSSHPSQDELLVRLDAEPGFVTPEDKQWLQQVYAGMAAAPKTTKTPEELAAIRNQVLASLTRRRSVTAYGMLVATGADLAKIVSSMQRPALPEGTTPESIRQSLIDFGISEVDADATVQTMLIPQVDLIANTWRTDHAKIALIKNSLDTQTAPEIEEAIRKGYIDSILNKGAFGLALMLPVEAWNWFAEPIHSVGAYSYKGLELAATTGVLGLQVGAEELAKWFGHTPLTNRQLLEAELQGKQLRGYAPVDLTKLDQRAITQLEVQLQEQLKYIANWEQVLSDEQDKGASWGEALRAAYEGGTNLSTMERLVAESFDPLIAFGFGAYKGLPWLGKAEAAWIQSTDKGALWVKHGLTKLGGTTLSMDATRGAKAGAEQFVATMSDVLQKPFIRIPLGELQDKLHQIIDEGRTQLGWGGQGREVFDQLTDRVPLTRLEVVQLGQTVKSTTFTTLESVTPANILAIDQIVKNTKGLGRGVYEKAEGAAQLLAKLNAPVNAESQFAALRFIDQYQQGILSNIDVIAAGANPALGRGGPSSTGVMLNLFDHQYEVLLATRQSEVVAANAERAGWSAWVHKIPTDKVLLYQSKLDAFNRGWARQYLITPTYGPFNILETAQKMALSGLDFIWYRGVPGTTAATNLRLDVPIAQLQDLSQGLVIPLQFTTLQAQPLMGVARGLKEDIATLAMPRVSNNRLNTAWDKVGATIADWWNPTNPNGGIQRATIKASAKIQLSLESGYIGQAYWREFKTKWPAVHKELTDDIESNLMPALLKAGMPEDWARAYATQAAYLASTGNEAALKSMPATFDIFAIDEAKISQMLAGHPQQAQIVNDLFIQAVRDRSLFTDTAKAWQIIEDGMLQGMLHDPTMMRWQFKSMVDEAISNPPRTLDEMHNRLVDLSDLVDMFKESVSQQASLTQQVGAGIINKAAKSAHFDKQFTDILTPYMAEVRAQTDRLVEHLTSLTQQKASEWGLSPSQVENYTSLMKKHIDLVKGIDDTRLRQHIVEEEWKAAHGGTTPRANDPNVGALWQDWYRVRNEVWQQERLFAAENTMNIEALYEKLAGETLPFVRATGGRALTAVDVARLFGNVHPNSVTQGMVTERGMWRSKEDFVQRVWGRANRVGKESGRTADELGYTKKAIGDFYDNVKQAIPTEPILADLESLKQELYQYAQTRGGLVTPEMKVALEEAVNGSSVAPGLVDRLKANQETGRMFKDIAVDDDGALLSKVLIREEQDSIEYSIQQKMEKFDALVIRPSPISRTAPYTRAEFEAAVRKAAGKPSAQYDPNLKGFSFGSEADMEGRLEAIARATGDPAIPATKLSIVDTMDAFDFYSEGIQEGRVSQLLDQVDSFINMVGLEAETLHIDNTLSIVRSNLADIAAGKQVSTGAFTKSWNDLRNEVMSFGDEPPILGAVKKWFGQVDNDSLQELGRLAEANPQYKAEIQRILRERYPTGYLRVYRGGGKAKEEGLDPLARKYVNTTTDKSIAEEFAPANSSPEGLDWQDVIIRVEDVLSIGSAKESELIVPSQIIRDRMANPLTIPHAWNTERQSMMDTALRQYEIDFPDRSTKTIVNSVMTTIFPFWSYESHRWPWIAREYLRHPGIMRAWEQYMSETDLGYISIPGSNLRFNLLRGTIWMGGMRRLIMRDYPSYYEDNGVSNAFDDLSRLGYFPNIILGGLMALHAWWRAPQAGFQGGPQVPQYGNALLNAYLLANPQSDIAAGLKRTLLGDNYGDFLNLNVLGSRGINGTELLNKIQQGIALSDDEQKLWRSGYSGLSGSAAISILMDASSFINMVPRDKVKFQDQVRLLIQEATGISVQTQKEQQRAGVHIEDYAALLPQVSDLIKQLDGYVRWSGTTTYLGPSMAGQVKGKITQFFSEVDKQQTDRVAQQLEQDKRLALNWLGQSDPLGRYQLDSWNTDTKELAGSTKILIDTLRGSARYQWRNPKTGKVEPIPLTIEERLAYALAFDADPPIRSALEEWQALYFAHDPDDPLFKGIDPNTGNEFQDWGKYYGWQAAALNALPPDLRQEATQWMRRRETTLQALRRADYEQYIRPYRILQDVVKARFSAADQITIAKFQQSDDTTERQALNEVIGESGQKVMSQFRSELGKLRDAMRTNDPDLDARLNLWGEAGSFKTDQAGKLFEQLKQQYGQLVLAQ